MPMEKEAVISEALALPEEGRAEVATRLLESLSSPGDDFSDEELLEEATRRSEEMERDPSSSLTHDQFLEQVSRRRA